VDALVKSHMFRANLNCRFGHMFASTNIKVNSAPLLGSKTMHSVSSVVYYRCTGIINSALPFTTLPRRNLYVLSGHSFLLFCVTSTRFSFLQTEYYRKFNIILNIYYNTELHTNLVLLKWFWCLLNAWFPS
jgi:hypothetical protein